jgi:hypothetical protein
LEFLKSKFDNISLFIVLVLLMLLMLHITHHHGDENVMGWMEQTFTTVLGAYIALTQVHRVAWNKPNGGQNGTKKDDSSTGTPVVPAPDGLPQGPIPGGPAGQ